METDVLVVGAGPAGSMAAKYAALGGARTLLIEKRQEIGSPVRCGEGVSRSWMEECGVKPDPRWIANQVEGARIYAPNGACMIVNEKQAGNEVGIVLERDQFDKALAEQAIKAGADVLLKTYASNITRSNGTVTGITGKTLGEDLEVKAKVVIGADGFESQVGRWAGLHTGLKTRDVDATLQYRLANIDCDRRYCDFYLGSIAPGGYIWVFPKGEDVANVGIGVQLSQLQGKADTRSLLDRWIARQPGLAKGKPLDIVAGAVSTCKPLPKTVTGGLMLVGDAARLIDPITGGGIANGCISGKLAGEVAAQALQAGDVSPQFLHKYERAWRARMEKTLLRNWMAKEKLVKLSDDVFNRIIATLAEVNLPHLTTYTLLKAVQEKHPELVKELAELLTEP
ncbi:MAG: NAD(P)/FAD-dependent oxidoreductase [Euryarchaeota archaeon]|nr:NAD(P)/FAD-dependent oxidoreductase [Euryarchaeota archaeon]